MTAPAQLISRPPPMGKVRAYILRMAGLSTTAIKVLRICNEANTCANTLNRVISLDPVLTGRVLQLINSAYYCLPSKVNSLTRAIILLGINTVKNVVLSFALLQSFSRRDAFRAFPADGFWAHSLSVAAGAKLLAGQHGVQFAEREDFFVAGLMHDIGKVPLNHLFTEEYRRAAAWARSSGASMRDGEQAVIGIDHGAVGEVIARKWELSPALCEALALHHHPPDRGEGRGLKLVQAVALADALTHGMGIGIAGRDCGGQDQGRRVLDAWGVTPAAAAALAAAVDQEIEKARIFLEIAGRD